MIIRNCWHSMYKAIFRIHLLGMIHINTTRTESRDRGICDIRIIISRDCDICTIWLLSDTITVGHGFAFFKFKTSTFPWLSTLAIFHQGKIFLVSTEVQGTQKSYFIGSTSIRASFLSIFWELTFVLNSLPRHVFIPNEKKKKKLLY